MKFYALLSRLLFKLQPYTAHRIALDLLTMAPSLFLPKPVDSPLAIMGLNFKNRVGLAPGFDVNGDYLHALNKLGFGFIEVGGVTPKPQSGHSHPRIIRLEKEKSLWNRVGFPNKGIHYLVSRLKRRYGDAIIGVNVAKNHVTPMALAAYDYIYCIQAAYPYADYITINISSPNTLELRDLQKGKFLITLLSSIKLHQSRLRTEHRKYVPFLIKISPDLSEIELSEMAEQFIKFEIDGVIVSNTTVRYDRSQLSKSLPEGGGISGQLLRDHSLITLKQLQIHLKNQIPIIALGGIMQESEALLRISEGASLIQIYSALIYEGPEIVRRLSNAIRQSLN